MIQSIVLDSWAVLALLQEEPFGKTVKDFLQLAEGKGNVSREVISLLKHKPTSVKLFLSVINLGEVFYILGRKRGELDARRALGLIRETSIERVPAEESIVVKAASIKMKYPLSYADAFVVATAIACKGSILTGDAEFRPIHEVPILWLR